MTNKELKTGFTTGTCATAAVKGAAALLFGGVRLSAIPVVLPGGGEVTLIPHGLRKTRAGAFCSIVKDAGDDPDVTDGAVISAALSRLDQPTVRIEGGRGVGRVTRKGLQVSVGEPAINPVPRKMIEDTVTNFLPAGEGARVVIGVKNGAALARKTFNPRLGIMGGISILGTTGIVEPKSVDALKTSLVCGLDIAHAEGHKTIIMVPGQIGERGIKKHLSNKNIPVIQMSNFVGFMLKMCREKDFRSVILAGHPGKLVKIIRGDFDTHSARSESALPLVMKELSVSGRQSAVGSREPNTVEEIIQTLEKTEKIKIFSRLAEKISRAAGELSTIKVGVVLLSMNGDYVGSYLPISAMEGYFA